MIYRQTVIPLAFSLLILAGCQQDVVQRRANKLTSTVPNMYYEQVLDNLAATQVNPEVLPYFGVPTQGTHTNSRQYQGSYGPGFDLVLTGTLGKAFLERWLFDKQTLGFQGTVQNQEAFQLQPVTNPDKLLMMQTALRLCAGNSHDPVFEDQLRRFYANRNVFFDYWPWVSRRFYNVTCSKHEAYKNGCYIGKCGDTYVYVTAENVAELTHFTLALLEIVTVADQFLYADPTKPGTPRELRFPFPTPPVAPTL